MESTAGIRELRARLRHYLRRVRAGETVVITDHGEPIGRIVPYGDTAEERLSELMRTGLLTWSGQRLVSRAPVARARGERSVTELLLEGRE